MADTGSDFKILSFALDTSFSSVTTTVPFKSALVKLRGGGNCVIRRSTTDTVEFDLEGGAVTLNRKGIPQSGDTLTICQAKVDSGTGTLQVILTLT